MMFGNVLEWNQSDSDDMLKWQIWAAAILEFFQRGYVTIVGQNLNFFESL